MAEYSSLKVPELKKLLAEKGLAQTGNKADLIARLQEHDKESAGGAADKPAAEEAEKPKETKEDEITYSDDEAAKPAAAAPKADEPAAAPSAEATDAAKPAESEAAPADEPAEPAVSYAAGLASTTADEEAKKRADRAKRFGIEEDDDSKKRAERAKRFGIDEKDLASGLDSALPERPLKRGRGRDVGEGGRPGKRQSLDRRGGGRRRGGRREGGGGGGGGDAPANKTGILDDPAEKAKAEKRAARFAAA